MLAALRLAVAHLMADVHVLFVVGVGLVWWIEWLGLENNGNGGWLWLLVPSLVRWLDRLILMAMQNANTLVMGKTE